jgi:hypothetical protein
LIEKWRDSELACEERQRESKGSHRRHGYGVQGLTWKHAADELSVLLDGITRE